MTTRQASNPEVDVIVLGVGTCGEDLSLRLLEAGLTVTGVEASLVGGECAYWACLPSKAMIRASNALAEARRVNQLAGTAEVTANWKPVADRVKDEVSGGWQDTTAVHRFETRGGRLIHGRGKLVGPRAVEVNGETLTARIGVVVATGSRSVIPDIPGLAEVSYWTTHDLIQTSTLPDSLLILGGGVVACELGQVMSRFGVKVTILEAGERLLSAEEPEASNAIEAAFEAEGIEIRKNQPVVEIRSDRGSIVCRLEDGTESVGERLLVSAGRVIDLAELGLDSIGLTAEKSIPVDERMRVADGIWAMGDVTGKAMFTHVALYQSSIVAGEILNENPEPARYDAVPRAIFTDPEVGAVGMTEAQALAAGLDVIVTVKQLQSTFKGWLNVAGAGVIKLVADRSTGTLLGATVTGPHAGETLGLLSLAVHEKIPLSSLRTMIYAFPTFYGGVGEAIGAFGRGLATVIDPSYEGFRRLDVIK